MRDFALIQTAPGRLLVGWGPFSSADRLAPGTAAFYLNDFFLEDPAPWKIPASWETTDPASLAARLGSPDSLTIVWDPADDAPFQSLFRSAHSAIQGGEFSKIVPVVFDHGHVLSGGVPEHLLSRLGAIPPALRIYGAAFGDAGMIGATPETLFTLENGRVETMAVAGTRGREAAAELLRNPKERKEHDLVVRDIREQLEDLGSVEIGVTELLELPGLAHLVTQIAVEAPTADFEEIVNRLHPTSALGAWPRNDAAARWLRQSDAGVERGRFGAPFGVAREDGTAVCLVAIRNVAWDGDEVRIGSGAGIVLESAAGPEARELERKRAQVREIFDLPLRSAGAVA
ncbi:MAG: chorismate-binding protein [Thermoanaerobaculia bacterium]